MNRFAFIFLIVLPHLLWSQDENLKNYDHVYLDNIHSVKFHMAGLFLSYPIIDLDSEGALVLSFDDLDADVKDYMYTLQLCNADWSPSELVDMDYIDGFTEEKIIDYEYSYNTNTQFTHYRLTLPNENMRWTKSGNYLLKVYEDEDEKTLAITRRFMVVEPVMRVASQLVSPSFVSKLKTHHEIDFVVSHKGIKVNNPQSDIKVAILQNGRWDNAITGLKPLFVKGEQLIYDFQNKVVFPAGKEFRFADLRSLRYRLTKVEEIQEFQDGVDVFLYRDRDRSRQAYLFDEDVNGNFLIENLNENDNDLEADYANVIISLVSDEPFKGKDLYILGGLTDWGIQEKFKLKYSQEALAYELVVKLKQGFYNYIFALVDQKTGQVDMERLEGNWYETENQYTILVYFRPFGTRYDRLVAVQTIDSSRQ